MKKIYLFIIVLFLVGCSTPIYTLGPHQNTNVMSGKWTFYGEGDDMLEVDIKPESPEAIAGGFHFTGVKKIEFDGTGIQIEQNMRTTRTKVLLKGTHGESEDVINAALAQHGGINELVHGEGDDKEIPEDVFTTE